MFSLNLFNLTFIADFSFRCLPFTNSFIILYNMYVILFVLDYLSLFSLLTEGYGSESSFQNEVGSGFQNEVGSGFQNTVGPGFQNTVGSGFQNIVGSGSSFQIIVGASFALV